MKRMALAITGLLCAGHAFAQSAESLDLRVPEQPNPYMAAAASPPRDPPGTYYGDTSGRPATGSDANAEADDGKAKVWGSFTTGIGHTKGYGTSRYNAAEVNVSKSFGDGERPNNVNLQIRVEQGDGPAFGGRGPYPYYGPDHFGPDPYYPPPR